MKESILLLFVFLLIWFEFHFIRNTQWKKIRRLGTIHAGHITPVLSANGDILFPITRDSPWRDQSRAYREMLVEIAILVSSFAMGVSTFLMAWAWPFLAPSGLGWKALASFGLYLIFLPLAFYWGYKLIPALITVWLHYPRYYFHAEEVERVVSLRWYLIEYLFLAAFWIVMSDMILPMGFLWAVMISLEPLILPLTRREYLAWGSDDDILEDFDFVGFDATRAERIEEICDHPCFEALLASLPEHTREITLMLLDGRGTKQELFKKADLAPDEEWLATPLLKKMFNQNPEFLQVVILEMLYTLKGMLKDFKPQQPATIENTR